MKKIIFPTILFIIILSCTKKNELGDLKYVNTVPGGCVIEKGSQSKGTLYKSDVLTYSVINDTLNIFVGFNTTCCQEFNSSSSIKGDSILIKITPTQIGVCNCICYYTFDFKYIGHGNYYKYCAIVGNFNFVGQIVL
jgi:hypothetical protein